MNKISDNNGWICLHRKIRDNPIYGNSDYIRIWIEILLLANHKPTSFIWNNQKMVLKEGQLLTSLLGISERLNINISKVYRVLEYLESEKQIEKRSTTKYTIITVLNWNEYQENEKQMKNKLKTDEKQTKTYNNVNNDNNDNKTISKDIGKTNQSNPDINELINYLKEKVGNLDDSIQ